MVAAQVERTGGNEGSIRFKCANVLCCAVLMKCMKWSRRAQENSIRAYTFMCSVDVLFTE